MEQSVRHTKQLNVMREQFRKELKKYNTELLSNNLKVKHSLASVFVRGFIHSDDQSY